jgi:hypothetical protein
MYCTYSCYAWNVSFENYFIQFIYLAVVVNKEKIKKPNYTSYISHSCHDYTRTQQYTLLASALLFMINIMLKSLGASYKIAIDSSVIYSGITDVQACVT